MTECGLDLLKGLLQMNPDKRLKAEQALTHPYFKESPLPQNVNFMPTAPETNLSGNQSLRESSPLCVCVSPCVSVCLSVYSTLR